MEGRVGGRKVPYQVFISLLDEASTRGPAFEKNHEKKKIHKKKIKKKDSGSWVSIDNKSH